MSNNPTEVESYIKGANFPATGTQLAGVAALNNAPAELVDALSSFASQEFESAPAVTHALTQHSG